MNTTEKIAKTVKLVLSKSNKVQRTIEKWAEAVGITGTLTDFSFSKKLSQFHPTALPKKSSRFAHQGLAYSAARSDTKRRGFAKINQNLF